MHRVGLRFADHWMSTLTMPQLQISLLVPPENSVAVVARNRRAAAGIALAMPIFVLGVLVAGLAKNGFDPRIILQHSGLRITLLPGLLAMVFWIRRYWPAAFHAIVAREPPIIVDGGKLSFFGDEYPIASSLGLEVRNGAVRLLDGSQVISERPLFFVKSDQLGINRHNL